MGERKKKRMHEVKNHGVKEKKEVSKGLDWDFRQF